MARSQRRLDRIRQVLAHKQPDLTVVMENIHDPHNVSAILRSCDAVGVVRVDLLYTVEAFPKIGKKSSSSANKWIETRKHRKVEECYARLRDEGFRICATTMAQDSVSLYDLELAGPTAFVLGNEHRGVSPDAARLADVRIMIPMVGMIESLNVSVAAAVCLYESFRQRAVQGLYASPRLGESALSTLTDAWIRR
jgi:tRNA (guanosine-2'-O-)-methyltransferase